MRARRDFLAANRGIRIVTPSFILLVHRNETGEARVGFTASRKVGGSVMRNRAKRRLREMARLLRSRAIPGADHVFIARPSAEEQPFAQMLSDGARALDRARNKVEGRAR